PHHDALLPELQPPLKRDRRGGIGIRPSTSSGGERPVAPEDKSPPPAGIPRFLDASLTPSKTFRTFSGSVITEIMCRRPTRRGHLKTSTPKTLFKRSDQRIYR
ncbi:MAG: hypothetical protein ACJAQ3_001838, partial [Planctomycetota bacterium]